MHRALLAVGLATSIGCTPPARAPSAPGVDEQVIATMLDDWHAAASRADEARYFAHLDERAVFLGTDATERWDKPAFRAYAHPHFAKGKAWSFNATRRAITRDTPSLAHFDEQLDTVGLGPARGSGVVIREADGTWKLLQYNLAITVPNARFAMAREAADTALVLSSKGDALADLGFLAGAWVARDEHETTLEQWSNADGGTMLGHGRTVRDGKQTFFESLRIERRGAITVYVAQPSGGAPTEFTRVASSAPQSVVFENLQHDWPKRITYTRVGNELRARAEGAPGQRVAEWTLRAAVIDRAP